jgi:polyisoprenoid-binding protein YceI
MKKTTKWELDQAHCVISFSVRHLMISRVKGSFTKFDASIYTWEKDFTKVEIDIQIEAASISTGDEKRDEHLRGFDFFDTQNHHQISFTANEMGNADDSGKQQMWGDLTIKGVTKRILLSVEAGGIVTDLLGKEKAGFKISGLINRTDWGLQWNQALEAGGLLVSEEVEIECDFELINVTQEELVMELDSRDDSYAKPL